MMFSWLSGLMMNPGLAVGALGVASPILIHIFSRRRFRRIRWAAMDFLLDAERKNRRRVKIEQLVLLALRCLAVLLIALMITRPFIQRSSLGAWIGAGPRTERIVLLDDSFSMGYRVEPGETVFSKAKSSVSRLAKALSEQSPSDSFTLLLTSRPESPIAAIANLSEENVLRLDDALEPLTQSESTARWPEAIASVAEFIRRSNTQANTCVYFVSDFQRIDWLASSGDAKSLNLMEPFAPLQDSGRKAQLVLLDVSANSPQNIAVVDIRPLQPQSVAGVPSRYEVSIANHSPTATENVEIGLSNAHQVLPPVTVPRISSGQVVSEQVETVFQTEGSDFLRAQLAGAAASNDRLVLDNSRYAALDVLPSIQVLLVDGEPSGDPYRDEAFLLKTALRPAGRAASGNDVTVVDDQELEGVDLTGYHVVILLNVARLGATAVQNLEKFVAAGGGLVIFAGDQLDAEAYNQQLYKDGRGLLPAPLGEVMDSSAGVEPPAFGEWDSSHPVMRAFVDPLGALLRSVHVESWQAVDEVSANRPPTSSATSGPASPARVLARFNDPAHSAAILQRPFNRGISLLITTTADQEWNDWASNFSYVPMMLEMVQYAARASNTPSQVVVGEAIRCPFDARAFKNTARIRTPDYPNEPEVSINAEALANGESVLVYKDTGKSGVYSIQLDSLSGEPVTRYAAVNPAAAESDLAAATRTELESAFGEMKFDYVRDMNAFAGETAGARAELWWPLLLAAVAVLMAEQGLAWWFGARG